MTSTVIERFTADPEGLRLLQQAGLIFDVTELMCATLEEQSVTRAELAKRMEKSKGRISQILNGETNLTLQTIADVFTALGKTLTVRATDICEPEPQPPEKAMQVKLPPPLPNTSKVSAAGTGTLHCLEAIVAFECSLGMGA